MNIEKELPGIKKNISLVQYTTFKIGGKAKYFCTVGTKEELIEAVKAAKKMRLPFFILGKGSNLLVSDKGFNGIVIKIVNCKLKVENRKISADAGVPLNKLVSLSAEKSLTDMEWAVGIPGTVGGAVYGNAGSFGKSMKDVVDKVEVYDIKTRKVKIVSNKDCKFAYRESIFKKNKNLIILSTKLSLIRGEKKEIKNKIKEYLKYKKGTQPLNYPSAGSVFKNPKNFSAGEPGEENKFSSSNFTAAQLIEKCGLKGERAGGAKISEKHANFIVNFGGATAKDAKKLINLAKKSVKRKFGIVLKEEIQHIGFEN